LPLREIVANLCVIGQAGLPPAEITIKPHPTGPREHVPP
jgi:hypothetical protein